MSVVLIAEVDQIEHLPSITSSQFTPSRPRATVFSTSGRRSGHLLIEFAIVAALLFMLVLGMIELGRAYMVRHLLTNAARASCRTGMLSQQSSAQMQTAAINYLHTSMIQGAIVTVRVNGSETFTAIKEDDEIQVTVSVPLARVSWIPGTTYLGGVLTGTYSVRREME